MNLGSLLEEDEPEEESSSSEEEEEEEDPVSQPGVVLTELASLHNHISDDSLDSLAIVFISGPAVTGSVTSQEPDANLNDSPVIDVVFSWPQKGKSKKVEPLVSSHGMFSTLYKLLVDVTGSQPLISRVRIDGDLTDISYVSDNGGESLLLVAVGVRDTPAQATSSTCLCRFTTRLAQSLVFKWGNLTRAFRNTQDKEMARFLSNASASLLNPSPHDFLFASDPPVIRFLPKHILLGVEETMYTLEGSDFGEEMDQRQDNEDATQYHCLGSVIFFKGQLVASHLENELQSQFYTWMMTELNKWGASSTWTSLKRLVLWQPSFVASVPSASPGQFEGSQPEETPESSCRYSVLLGLDYFLLGFILEPVTPCQRFSGPDTLWIGKGMESLIQLVRPELNHFLQMGAGEAVPASTCADGGEMMRTGLPCTTLPSHQEPSASAFKNQGDRNVPGMMLTGGSAGGRSSSNATVPTNNSISHSDGYPSPNLSGSSKSSHNNNGNPTIENLIDEFEASHILQDYHQHHSHANLETARGDGSLGPGTATGSDASSSKLSGDGESDTASTDRLTACIQTPHEALAALSICRGNFVYDFVQLEYGRGVMITTTPDCEERLISSGEILMNFRCQVLVSHEILHKAANSRTKLTTRERDWKWTCKALTPIFEHGSLFECQVQDSSGLMITKKKLKKKLRKVCYWVIGRLYEDQREIYICLQDTIDLHNVLELAFKIAHVIGLGADVLTNNDINYQQLLSSCCNQFHSEHSVAQNVQLM